MVDSYANAFQVHQKPLRTSSIHKTWMRKLPYFWYLVFVATPVDIYAHTYQFVFGEREAFLEGGAFFIPYQLSHWTLLSVALMAQFFHGYFPQRLWPVYFAWLKFNLVIHEYIYRLTLRKMTIGYRLFEFGLFLGAMCFLCHSGPMIDTLINAITDFHSTVWKLHWLQSLSEMLDSFPPISFFVEL